jgi:6-phosphofructokinase 1
VQRGAAPGAFDRLLGSRLGAGAVTQLASGVDGVLVGLLGQHVRATPLDEVVGGIKPLNPRMVELAGVLAS